MIGASAALLMPWLSGFALLLAVLGRPFSPLRITAAAGLGYLVGLALVGALLWLAIELGAAQPALWAAAGLWLIALVASPLAWRRQALSEDPPRRVPSRWIRGLWWLALTVMLIHFVLLLSEALVRPVYPWDAWSAWAVKAKVWSGLGHYVDFVSFQAWLADASASVYTNEAWQYPELLPLLQFWITRWTGGWDQNLVMLPWPLLWAAGLTVFYAGLRRLRIPPVHAILAVFLLSTLPIMAVQAALPGYADLWMAMEILAFMVLLSWWLQAPRAGLVLVGTILLVMMAATKLEGVLWGLICLLTAGVAALGVRRGAMLLGLMAVGLAMWWLLGGFTLALGGGWTLQITPQLIEIPWLGRYPLGFSSHWGAFGRAFLSLPNWHLTWYLLGPLILALLVLDRHNRWLPVLLTYLLLGLGFLFLLFFFTQAGVWAESMTASNRLALHFVPGCLYWLSLALSDYLRSATPVTSR